MDNTSTPIPQPIPPPAAPPAPILASPATAPVPVEKVWPKPSVYVPESNGQPAMPSVLKMAGNLAYTAGAAIGNAVIHQQVMASDDVYNKRIETCTNCDALDKNQWRCSKCGCFMKAKAKMIAAKCPLSKWTE
jgi:hypothetical protein